MVKPILETRNVSDIEMSEMSVNLLKTRGNKMSFIPVLLNFNAHIQLGPKQSFGDLLNVWKDDLAFRVSGKWF